MNMKKVILTILAVALVAIAAVVLCNVATTKEVETTVQPEEVVYLEGVVTEVTEEYFVMQEKERGEIQVNVSGESLFEGVTAETIKVGQYAYVVYNGMMTRSLPPQVFAMQVTVNLVGGTVLEIGEGSVTISQENGEAILFLPEGAPELTVGDEIIASTTGTMTMSIPPQMTAMTIEIVAAQE